MSNSPLQETTWVPQLPEYLYLGGAPHDMLMFHDADLTIPAHGLRGCILSFVLAEAELDLFGEAVTGQDIIECDSAVCSSLPCHNSGVCNQVSTFYRVMAYGQVQCPAPGYIILTI